jgi:uncharacterized protein
MASPARTQIWMGIYHAAAMFWETLWALVLGFGISAALQIFVSKERMTQLLGRAGLKEIFLATVFGAASSSCSYAAVAAGRSAFQKGAALIPVLAFMFASTNLVVELGAMIWVLMGWQFVLAEVVGGLVLIATMWLLVRLILPREVETEARRNAEQAVEQADHRCHPVEHQAAGGKIVRLANAFVNDWRVIWKELVIGFLVAGFLSALVPSDWWKALFVESGPAWVRLIENAAVGPLIGILSWVCSCANIPLASLLWSNGISFGGVISFIYADLIVIPIILIYGKYYGGRAAFYIVIIFYMSMVAAGLIVDLLFAGLNLIPEGQRAVSPIEHATFRCNYTTWLDFVAIAVALCLLCLKILKRRPA